MIFFIHRCISIFTQFKYTRISCLQNNDFQPKQKQIAKVRREREKAALKFASEADRQDLNAKSTLNTGIRLTNTNLKALWLDQSFITLQQDQIDLKNSTVTLTLGYVYKPTINWKINSVISSGFRSPNLDDVGKVREKNGKVTFLDP